MWLILLSAGLVLAFLATNLMLSPWIRADTTVTFNPRSVGRDPDAYLQRREALIPDIRAGLHKEIVWHDATTRRRTAVAVVYIHGFAASKEEIRPVPDEVSRALGANLFYTRLTGHGRTIDALLDVRANDWVNDLAEAMEIGRRIGDRVLMIASSTGAALAAWPSRQRRSAATWPPWCSCRPTSGRREASPYG